MLSQMSAGAFRAFIFGVALISPALGGSQAAGLQKGNPLCPPQAGDAESASLGRQNGENRSTSLGLGEVTLEKAERLLIRVQGYPELSAEYRVSHDNTVAVPVFGRTEVLGLTPVCLERILTERATKIARRDVFVTVEVAAFRPIFVTGAVAKPGPVPWAPGMNVLQATAMAGGLHRAQIISSAGTPTQARKSVEEKRQLLAKLARLKAEREGRDVIVVPEELRRISRPADLAKLIASQSAILASRALALKSEIESLERSHSVAIQELGSLESQSARVDKQLDLRRENRDKLQQLLAKGIVRAERTLEEEIRVSDLEQKLLENSVARARVSATIAQVERDLTNLRLGRNAQIDAEAAELERDIAQATIELAGQDFLEVPSSSETSQAGEVGYIIYRKIDSQDQRIPAGATSVVEVGDVILVSTSSP